MIAQRIRDRLVSGGVSQVYLGFLPYQRTVPAVSFVFAGDEVINTLRGEAPQRRERWQLDCWAERHADANQLAETVMTEMAKTESDFHATRISKSYNYEEQTELHRYMVEFYIYYT